MLQLRTVILGKKFVGRVRDNLNQGYGHPRLYQGIDETPHRNSQGFPLSSQFLNMKITTVQSWPAWQYCCLCSQKAGTYNDDSP
jgi:hypothetical protein